MAFNGVPLIEQLNDRVCRVSDVQLIASAQGTIGLAGATGAPPDVLLPASFIADEYTYQGVTVGLTSGIDVRVDPVSDGPFTNLPCSIQKSGTTPADFRIAIINTNAGFTTQTLAILIVFLGGGRTTQPSRIA